MELLICKLQRDIRLSNGDLQKIEECIVNIFDEEVAFIPSNYGFIIKVILGSLFIKRSDKIKIINELSEMGIRYKNYVINWHDHVNSDDFIYSCIIFKDIEFLECAINAGYILGSNHLIFTFEYSDLSMIHWVWNNARISNGAIKEILCNAIQKNNLIHIKYIVEYRKIDLKEVTSTKSRRSIALKCIQEGNSKLMKYFLSHGLVIHHDMPKCIEECLSSQNKEIADMLARQIICDKHEFDHFSIKTLSIWKLSGDLAKCMNMDILKSFIGLFDWNYRLITLLERMLIQKWYDGCLFVITKINVADNLDFDSHSRRMIRLSKKIKIKNCPKGALLYNKIRSTFPEIHRSPATIQEWDSVNDE